jgi:ATP phosphoribosyltransferase
MSTSDARGQSPNLRVALPNKGALSEDAVRLFSEAGYRCKRGHSSLRTIDAHAGVEFIFLRPRDIAVYVGEGVIDLGVSGRDLTLDSRAEVEELLELEFGHATFRLAVPEGAAFDPHSEPPPRIATSFTHLLADHLQSIGSKAHIVALDGAVELAPSLGVADAVADVVQTGRTLGEAGLATVGEPILKSQAVLLARRSGARSAAANVLIERVRGVVVASNYVMLEYDIAESLVAQASAITPGLEAPTLSPLSKPGFVAIRALVPRKNVNDSMDQLYELGARGIIAIDLRTCRL